MRIIFYMWAYWRIRKLDKFKKIVRIKTWRTALVDDTDGQRSTVTPLILGRH